MSQYKTPDVYVREKSILPPSVAEVATAIPAFIGHTTKLNEARDAANFLNKPVRITSMVQFEANFGGPHKESFTLTPSSKVFDIINVEAVKAVKDADGKITQKAEPAKLEAAKFFLHQAVSHFFANGGGACYVVSIGAAGTMASKEDYSAGIELLNKVDEVTLISSPEAIGLDEVGHYEVQNKALKHAEKRMDRFALVDVQMQEPADGKTAISHDSERLRAKVTQGLKYGASYYPYLTTTMARSYNEAAVMVMVEQTVNAVVEKDSTYTLHSPIAGFDQAATIADLTWQKLANTYTYEDSAQKTHHVSMSDVYIKNAAGDKYYELLSLKEVSFNAETKKLEPNENPKFAEALEHADVTLESYPLKLLGDPNYLFSSASLYNQAKAVLAKNYLVLPPSPAIAGVIAKTDKDRGVWKAPANIALSQVLAPTLAIDSTEQENLNVDATSGKSINAIRTFVGKGTLVWGARTLAGNDNEWRYVSVRRLFNTVEESIQKATQFAVFEPNTPFTWLKLKTMIESYLENLWRQGAFFGESPAQAFFVNVGLGQTMTEDDINNGIMNIEIGLAAVRPAEFIVLTFSHKSLEG
ncbi:phage tail sheath family protein [Pseudoalteromonas sp. S16_S37]|uniref:phage tail sheath family protein n=1 Tax=Pseudoalteromonas sp. S16_S37 TaxID=2720228 RepID=UPI00168082E5|nr:phage tail sheath C-terminal domain-containing protein [Pseudoalteromonas sp. S16_S37]MBD1583112.1 phage tail sheath family protein [Pseudoalteromonas sp. S16_S37]